MWTLEHWEKPDLDFWAAGSRGWPLPDGVVFGHQEYRPDLVQRLLTENPGLQFFEYFNVWTYPDASWIKQGNAYFDAVWSLLARGDIWVDPATNYSGMTPKDKMVIRWTDSGFATALSAMLVSSRSSARSNFFLDVYEPDGPYDWMFRSFDGAFSAERLPEDHVARHQTALEKMPAKLCQIAKVLTNGTLGHVAPGYGEAARYFEQVGTQPGMPWNEVLPESIRNSGNVISVLAEDRAQVDLALTNWLSYGGWLAFTTSLPGDQGLIATRAAYARATYSRSLRLDQPPPPWPPQAPTDPLPPTDPVDPIPPAGGLTP